MNKLLKKSKNGALNIIAVIFTVVPESLFEQFKEFAGLKSEFSIILIRISILIIVLGIVFFINILYAHFKKTVCIKGKDYSIQIEYGDIFKMENCKKVIPFDECFTTTIGDAPSNIKPTSVCGQYLMKNEIKDMQALIDNVQLKPSENSSKYQNQKSYESGRLVPNGDYLLMSFAKLDENGLGMFFTFEQLVDCLSLLWKEIDKYYGQKDVCIPIFGSGCTRMNGEQMSQQELLDIIIWSYKLSSRKIKNPHKLHIVCRKCDDFSLNKIGDELSVI